MDICGDESFLNWKTHFKERLYKGFLVFQVHPIVKSQMCFHESVNRLDSVIRIWYYVFPDLHQKSH